MFEGKIDFLIEVMFMYMLISSGDVKANQESNLKIPLTMFRFSIYIFIPWSSTSLAEASWSINCFRYYGFFCSYRTTK